MKTQCKKILAFMICAVMLIGVPLQSMAYDGLLSESDLKLMINDTAQYLSSEISQPQIGSIGGEWAVLGLARSGLSLPSGYLKKYYANVEAYVKNCGGILSERKYTEYSRVIIALTAIGKDPTNVAGYDLTMALGDYDKTVYQGLNGAIWALIALDCGNYEIPLNGSAKTQATREMYIKRILDARLSDGGWAFSGSVSEPDITGMALQALAKYTDRKDVSEAVEGALACMSKYQLDDGGFSSGGVENSESCAQMIVALCELGISPDDARFVKNGNSMLKNLSGFYRSGNGFYHVKDGSGSAMMGTEQCMYALVAAERFYENKSSLYRMADVKTGESADSPNGSVVSGVTGGSDFSKAVLRIIGASVGLGMAAGFGR